MAGGGSRRQYPEDVLPAGRTYRLPVRGAGRGTRTARRARLYGAVWRAGVARFPDRAQRRDEWSGICSSPGPGHRPAARHAGDDQHGRQHGRLADQGTDAAVRELWRIEHDRELSRRRPAAAGRTRTGPPEGRFGMTTMMIEIN